MTGPFRLRSLVWLAAPLCALGFLAWINAVRIAHIEYVSALGDGGGRASQAISPAAAAEFAAGNELIIPGHLAESYQWIGQTQQMFKRGEWRVRHVDSENAPFGRAVDSPSPYRWWLGLVAWIDHVFSARPLPQSVEPAALVANPVLHALFLVGTALFIAWRFGALPAALAAVAMATLFPFASEFIPGAPDDHGMAQIFGFWSLLLLLAGVRETPASSRPAESTRRRFFLAGITGGIGLWLSVSGQALVVAGAAAGALIAAWVLRGVRNEAGSAAIALPWRVATAGGAIATLIAYSIEFFPADPRVFRPASIHPLYALAWLGGGEVLAQAAEWIQGGRFIRSRRRIAILAMALAAISVVLVAMAKAGGRGLIGGDWPSFRLSRLPTGAVAESVGAWLARDGITSQALATFLPMLLVVPAVWRLVRRQSGLRPRVLTAIALGPVLVGLGFAWKQLVWWNDVDGFLLLLLVAATASAPGLPARARTGIAWAALLALVLLPGIWQLAPRAAAGQRDEVTLSELFGLIDRDLASALSLRSAAEGPVVLAPPNDTTALCYYGGLRGICTLSWENKDGVAAAVRILSASTPQEARVLIDQRKIAYLIFPSWDSTLDSFARAGAPRGAPIFSDWLRSWSQPGTLPVWLRPVAYHLPTIAGFEGQSVMIFEVVGDQDHATAASRIAEYFVEMGDREQAAAAAQALRRYPASLGAWTARAEVELLCGDEDGLAQSLRRVKARLAGGAVPRLEWDQRLGLAVLLARTKQAELSRQQLQVCLASADGGKLRELPTLSLYRLLVLSRAFDVDFDPRLHELALELLPAELRARLQ